MVEGIVDVEVDGKEIGRAGVEAWEVAGGFGGRPRLPSTWDRWGLRVVSDNNIHIALVKFFHFLQVSFPFLN